MLAAPLAASTLVINIVQAPCVVGEKPGALDIVCTIIIAVGCTLAVAFADHNTATYSLQEMLELWYVVPIYPTAACAAAPLPLLLSDGAAG
mgnify:CR=1 FL=1